MPAALIERFGIAHVADHPFRTLSSGERRRVSIARALMPDPDLLLLDEPGAGLDLGARETLIRDLTGLAGETRPESIVLVSHHVEEIPPGFGHALVLADGRAVAAGPIEEVVSAEVLGRAYGMPIAVERRDGRFWARRDWTARKLAADGSRATWNSQRSRQPGRRALTRDRHREAAG